MHLLKLEYLENPHAGTPENLETWKHMQNKQWKIFVETSVFHNLFACTILVSLSPVLGFSCTKNNKNKHSQ